jgi:thiamine transport system permease protein
VLLLGGGPRFTTLEVAIYEAVKLDFDIALASRLALVQMAIAFFLYVLVLRRSPRRVGADGGFVPLYRVGKLARLGYLTALFALAGAPLVSLVVSGAVAFPKRDFDLATASPRLVRHQLSSADDTRGSAHH